MTYFRSLVESFKLGALLAAVALFAGACSEAASPSTGQTSIDPLSSTYKHKRVCAAAGPGQRSCHAMVRVDNSGRIVPYVTPSGFGPSDLKSAYNLPATGGSGVTVAIVDAQDDPNAESDLAVYRSQFGLPACTTANGCFKKVNQSGATSPLPTADTGWAGEIALDIQMVSAACPSCHILLVEANSANNSDLDTAVNYAAAHAQVVSNSYGGSESSSDTSDTAYTHSGVAIFASSGDEGYVVEFPAASPHVIAVGGTALTRATGTSRGWTESVWSTSSSEGAGSGCSAYEAKPSWQNDTGCSKRTVADVSAVADPATGVAVYDTYGGSGWTVYGGTSVASPLVAAIFALTGHASATGQYPYVNTANFYDVTSGQTASCGSYLCTAGVNYDGPTGIGTPNGTAMAGGTTGTNDFTISATAASIAAGASGTSTVSTTASSGSGTVALTLSGVPTGVTASLASSSIAAGASTTLNITVASTVAAGSYTITISGTEGTSSHSTTAALTVTSSGGGGGGSSILSDGFETTTWTSTAVAGSGASWAIVTSSSYPSISAHGGTHFADFNSYTSSANTSARLSANATIAMPSTFSSASLTFWVYHDTGYSSDADSVQAQISTNGTTWTSVGSAVNRYDGTTGWAQVTVDVSAYLGQTIHLAFLGTSQYGNDVYVDDVAITGAGSGGGGSTFSISGTITASGAGLAGVTVNAGVESATTSSTGAFSLAGLAAGRYTLTPSLTGYTFSPASQSVTISTANVAGIAFTATATGTGGGTLLSDGFEAAGWTSTTVAGSGGAFTIVTSSSYPSINAHGGSHWADFNSYTSASGSQTRLARTAVVVIPSTVTTVTLKFWMYHDTGYSSDADSVTAQVSTNGTTWTSVGSAVNRYNGSTGWAQATVDLSAYKGQTIHLGLLGTSKYGNDCYVDDVTITAQ